MSLTVRILIALLLGLGLGIALTEWGGAWEGDVVALAQPVGSAWLNGLQMPLIPLIFALLVTGIAQAATTARSSGMAGRAILLFALLLTASAAVAALVGPLMLHLWPGSPGRGWTRSSSARSRKQKPMPSSRSWRRWRSSPAPYSLR